jgi:hypothetical protein
MSCEGCNQKIKAENAQYEKTVEEAQERANSDGQWYAIYADSDGTTRYLRADLAGGYPVTRYVSPKLPNP